MMEFMYCIPDLEIFIDKTIKKCLLEYDLDANDTETVLDDMEKAWPKSPPRSQEKQVLKDCNDNTQKVRSYKHLAANETEDIHTLDKGKLKTNGVVTSHKSRELAEQGDRHEVLSNGKCGSAYGSGDCSRSDTSSPDDGDRRQAQKHPKLKSRLQERYFGGHERSKNNDGQTKEATKEGCKLNKVLPSNLDLLASAANIYESNRGTQEHRMQAIRRLQEESDRQFWNQASTSCPESSSDGPQPARAMTVLTRPTSLPSTTQRPSPIHSSSHKDSASTSSNRLETTVQRFCTKLTSDSPIEGPWEDDTIHPLVNTERAKRLLEHYQNGYNDVIPRETVVVRRQLSTSSDVGDPSVWNRQSPSLVADPSLQGRMFGQSKSATSGNSHPHHPVSETPRQHGTQISSIIAEELQKDSVSHLNTFPRFTIPSTRTIPTGTKYSAAQTSTTDSTYLPEPYARTETGNLIHLPFQFPQVQTQLEFGQNGTDTVFRTMPQILPAHSVRPSHYASSSILAFHLGRVTPTVLATTTDVDQPEDLSTKSRRQVEDVTQPLSQSCPSFTFSSSVTATGKVEYSSGLNSALGSFIRSGHIEYIASRKSSSPSNDSDRMYNHDSGSPNINSLQKTSGSWEKSVQGHSLDIIPTNDRLALDERSRLGNLKRWSDLADSEERKKRKTE